MAEGDRPLGFSFAGHGKSHQSGRFCLSSKAAAPLLTSFRQGQPSARRNILTSERTHRRLPLVFSLERFGL
jgi:hypothetical protein